MLSNSTVSKLGLALVFLGGFLIGTAFGSAFANADELQVTKQCLTLDAIKITNKPFHPDYYVLNQDQMDLLRNFYLAQNNPIPEVIVSIVAAHSSAVNEVGAELNDSIFLYGFDKDGCGAGAVKLPRTMLKAMLGIEL